MGKPKAPAAPDPIKTAAAQSASNRETAITQTGLNAINQYGPTGSVTYKQNGTWADGTPRFEQTTALSPEQQQLYNTGVSTSQNLADVAKTQSGRINDLLGQPFSLDNAAVEGRINELASARLDPQLAKRREQAEASLASRGIKLGSEAYDTAIKQVMEGENDARNQLLLTGRNQAVQEALLQRTQPLNEILALAGGSQVQTPQFGATPQSGVAGTDVAGLINSDYQNKLNTYNQQQSATMGGLFNLGSAALGMFSFSDKRLKTDIKATGESVAGVPVKEWRWKDSGQPDIGVIAQDVEKKHPKLVEMDPSGYRKVNYPGLMRLGTSAMRRAA